MSASPLGADLPSGANVGPGLTPSRRTAMRFTGTRHRWRCPSRSRRSSRAHQETLGAFYLRRRLSRCCRAGPVGSPVRPLRGAYAARLTTGVARSRRPLLALVRRSRSGAARPNRCDHSTRAMSQLCHRSGAKLCSVESPRPAG